MCILRYQEIIGSIHKIEVSLSLKGAYLIAPIFLFLDILFTLACVNSGQFLTKLNTGKQKRGYRQLQKTVYHGNEIPLTKYAATDFLQIRGQVLVYFQHFEMKVKRSVLLTKRFLFLLAGLVGVTVLLQCSIFVLLSIYKIAGSCCFKIDQGTIRNQAKLSK